MATHNGEQRRNDIGDEPQQQAANVMVNRDQQQQIGMAANPRFGHIRDRLFQAMLIRLSLPYHQNVPHLFRRFFEFLTLINSLVLLAVLVYIHFLMRTYPGRCLEMLGHDEWPKKGIVRLEVIQNLAEFREIQARKENATFPQQSCHFNLAEIFRTGIMPYELRNQKRHSTIEEVEVQHDDHVKFERPMPIWFDLIHWLAGQLNQIWNLEEEGWEDEETEYDESRSVGWHRNSLKRNILMEEQKSPAGDQSMPVYHHLVEFSLHYGLLKLNMELRHELDVGVMLIQLDPEHDACFKDWRERFLMRYLIGMDELVLSSVKHLFENETDRGYLRDLISGELYHFVSVGPSSSSTYLTALIVMFIFTFAISMLLRFSHDQIFVFIVDLFQMFEQNQPLIFPVAPLLTVILALVGMEAIMSEIFNDTTTAFYVILLVWMADQYDAIFCHSPVGRRHWLRFFYLYHFAFYAYNYRYNGLYGGLALLTSAAFTFHSMVFFYHHYELPHIIYQEQLNDIANHLQNDPVGTYPLTQEAHWHIYLAFLYFLFLFFYLCYFSYSLSFLAIHTLFAPFANGQYLKIFANGAIQPDMARLDRVVREDGEAATGRNNNRSRQQNEGRQPTNDLVEMVRRAPVVGWMVGTAERLLMSHRRRRAEQQQQQQMRMMTNNNRNRPINMNRPEERVGERVAAEAVAETMREFERMSEAAQ